MYASPILISVSSIEMPSKIITLDRKQYGDAHQSQKVESVARRLRYRAMGKECRARGITNLLFAHHADDQAETVLMRLANNYLGKGLAGMQREAPIPECEDLYGVNNSGRPRAVRPDNALPKKPASNVDMLVEDGGITVIRPLLSYTKDRLVATCEEASVKWVEDHTNKDRSLTLRNTVRHLHETDLLPVALRRPNLCAIATQTSDRFAQLEARVDEIFRHFDITFDPRSGHAVCRIARENASKINALPDCDRVRAELLRKLLLIVAPQHSIDLSTLEAASSNFLEVDEDKVQPDVTPITVAGATAVRLEDADGAIAYELRRTLPPRNRASHLEVKINLSVQESGPDVNQVSWSEWSLWDERYWIRIGSTAEDQAQALSVVVRILTPEDINTLRQELPSKADTLHGQLAHIKGHLRTTLPALVHMLPDGQSRIVALPTLGWSRDMWFSFDGKQHRPSAQYYDIRYKHIDTSLTMPI